MHIGKHFKQNLTKIGFFNWQQQRTVLLDAFLRYNTSAVNFQLKIDYKNQIKIGLKWFQEINAQYNQYNQKQIYTYIAIYSPSNVTKTYCMHLG